MGAFIPNGSIVCEECYRLFFSYEAVSDHIDSDSYDEFACGIKKGKVNRIRCPHCKSKFSYEIPILTFSLKYNIAAIAAFKKEAPYFSRIKYVLKILNFEKIKLRFTDYASAAAEKIRIVSCGLDDLKIELLKVIEFPKYILMEPIEEYITFDSIKNNNLIFSHRDYKDDIISELKIPIEKYENFNIPLPNIPLGKWFKADKIWALDYLEEQKWI